MKRWGTLLIGVVVAAGLVLVPATAASAAPAENVSVVVTNPPQLIEPGIDLVASIVVTNGNSFPVTVIDVISSLTSTALPPAAPDFCDQFIISSPVEPQTPYGQELAAGESIPERLDNTTYVISNSVPNDCQGATLQFSFTVLLEPIPSTTVAGGTDHAFGGSGVLSATVTSVQVPTTGSVQFSVDGVPFGPTVALVEGSATLPVTGLAAGTHTVVAEYLPDGVGPDGSTSPPADFVVTAAPVPPPDGGTSATGGAAADSGLPPTGSDAEAWMWIALATSLLGALALIGRRVVRPARSRPGR